MPASRDRARRIAALLRTATDDDLVRELFADVDTIVRSVLGPQVDPHLRRTAVHDALLNVVRARHCFRGDGAASTWLYTITRREALRSVRRDRRPQEVQLAHEDFEIASRRLVEGPTGATALLAHEALECAVPNETWRRIWLLYNEPGARRDHDEVARLCDRSPGTVAVTLSRVRARIGTAA